MWITIAIVAALLVLLFGMLTQSIRDQRRSVKRCRDCQMATRSAVLKACAARDKWVALRDQAKAQPGTVTTEQIAEARKLTDESRAVMNQLLIEQHAKREQEEQSGRKPIVLSRDWWSPDKPVWTPKGGG